MTHFYEWSRSRHLHPLVVAPKAQPPGLRMAGDYSPGANKWMKRVEVYIPNVQHTLELLANGVVYCNCDIIASYHQYRLHPETSAMLALITQWGNVQPRFMPEGIIAASAIEQSFMSSPISPSSWRSPTTSSWLPTTSAT